MNSDGTEPFFNLFYIFFRFSRHGNKQTNKQRKLTTVNQKTHRSISIIDHCYWGGRGSRGGGMLGFFLGADWSVCVLRRTNHRQAGKGLFPRYRRSVSM